LGEKRLVRIFLMLVGGLLWVVQTFALPSSLSVGQLYHSQWTVRDGAPTAITTLAQTRDGFLWLGTDSGLFRFDGVQFEHIESVGGERLISSSIQEVWVARDGALWIGYLFGGVSKLHRGRLVNYREMEGLPRSKITEFAQGADGSMWTGTPLGLYHLENGRWQEVGSDWNVARGFASRLQLDARNTLWVVLNGEVVYLRQGARRFEVFGLRVIINDWPDLLRTADGHVWWIEKRQGVLTLQDLTAGDNPPVVLGHAADPTDVTDRSLFDREGNLWLAGKFGLGSVVFAQRSSATLRGPGAREHERVTLTGVFSTAMLEDREGNLWIGTNSGLDAFRTPVMARVDLTESASRSLPLDAHIPHFPLAPAAGGGMWIGSPDDVIVKLGATQEVIPGGPRDVLICFYTDRLGELWVGVQDALWHLRGGRWQVLRRPVEQGEVPRFMQALAMDAAGAMWVSVVNRGVYHIVAGQWVLWGGYAELPHHYAMVLTADEDGRIWFGYPDNTVAVLEGDRVQTLGASDGLQIGAVLSIAPRGQNVWIGGERGLGRWDGSQFQMVRWWGEPVQNISGIAVMPEGHLWLNTAAGAVYVDAGELGALADPRRQVRYRLFDHLDGMPGAAPVTRPLPTVAVDSDRRVWFSTDNGVVWTDPAHGVRNTVAPEVILKTATADGVSHDLSRPPRLIQLPVRTHTLEIRYTAPSLTVPERVRFRYRLEGSDTDWQEAGTRRQAFYTDLRPGHYRFRVIAANSDGVWNSTGSTVDLELPPTFTQTRWFVWLCALTALLGIWLLFSLRWHRAEAQLRWRLRERLIERERIARDLHDTFLQGIQGLMLRFQSATELIPMHEPARALMEQALDRADGVLEEGRDKVTHLRLSADRADQDLAQTLRRHGSDLEQIYGVVFGLSVAGVPRPLRPLIREEVGQIGKEALTNAFKHAQAARIEVWIEYALRGLTLRVSDDGRGFDPQHPRVSAGHWGLQGMRERAARCRARLSISSRRNEGATVELWIAARLVYKRSPPRWRRLARRLRRKWTRKGRL